MAQNMQSLIVREQSSFINGKWCAGDSEGAKIAVVNPADRSVISQIAPASDAQIEQAIACCASAFTSWSQTTGAMRSAYLEQFATHLARLSPELVKLQMQVNGKPMVEAKIDIDDAIATFTYYAQLAKQLDAKQEQNVPLPEDGFNSIVRYEPIGAVGLIVPWNFPLVSSAWKIAPALAAGCTVVLKTSEYTPLIELVYADIAQNIGLPDGVLNIVTGDGKAGAKINQNPRLAKISFTGSTNTGSKIMQGAAEFCRPVSLELGGKSPIIVFEDAHIEQAVEHIIAGIFFNCGQMCSATSRLLVHEQIYPRLISALVEKTRAIKVASPFDAHCMMGPLSNEVQFNKVQQYFDLAKRSGIECVFGGQVIDELPGFFVQPTIYVNVPTDSALWNEEIFGPVLCVRTFATSEQAIALANDSQYGLVATVVSEDIERCYRVARQLQAGHIWINSEQMIFAQTSWGGFKASGIGRELGPWGMHAFQGVKHITRKLS